MSAHFLDWGNQPDPFKVYPGPKSIPLPQKVALPQKPLSTVLSKKKGGKIPAEIGLEDLPASIQDYERVRRAEVPGSAARPATGARTLEQIEMDCILQALAKTNHNRTQAARLLGITRRRLGYRIAKYGLEERLREARGGNAEQGGEPPTEMPEASDPS